MMTDENAGKAYHDLVKAMLLTEVPDDLGTSQSEIREGESLVGKRWPTILREFYGEVGRWAMAPGRNSDSLIGPKNVTISNGILRFYVENQGASSWGVSVDDLAIENPRIKRIARASTGDMVIDEGLSLDQFLRMQVLYRAVADAPLVGLMEYPTHDYLKTVEARLESLPHSRVVFELGPFRRLNGGFVAWRSTEWAAVLLKENTSAHLFVSVTGPGTQKKFEEEPFLVDFPR